MARTKQIESEMSQELKEALARVKEIKLRESTVGKREEAKAILAKYESEYEHAKKVFFSVNSARRILKGLDKQFI